MFGIGGKKAVEGARSGLYAIYDRVAEKQGHASLRSMMVLL